MLCRPSDLRLLRLAPLALLVAACGGGGGGSSDNSSQTGPTLEFETAATTVPETFGTIQIRVQLDEAAGEDIDVAFTLTGTADGATDYQASASPITIAAGQTTGQIFVDVTDDMVDEDDETVVVTLQAADGYQLGAVSVHTVTIQDDENALVEIEDNDNVVQALANGSFGTLTPGTVVQLTGYVYNEIDLSDPNIDRVDAFFFEVPADVNVTVTTTPLGNGDLTILLGGPGGNALIPGNGIQNENGLGEQETYSLDIAGGDDFFVGVFCIENETEYFVQVDVTQPTQPLVAGDGPGLDPASIQSPELRHWLEVNGLLPEQPVAVERRQGWILDGDQVHGYTEEVVRRR